MSATSRAIRPIATAGLRAAPSMTVLARLSLGLVMLALMLATPTASAEERAKGEVARLGEHPAVVVARRGVQVDPTSKFYLHPARLSWSLQRPTSQGGESPAKSCASAPLTRTKSRTRC
jgi:hypothetical protein